MVEPLEYKIDFISGDFLCEYCKRRFPTHYQVKKGQLRRQLGRRWVAGNNIFFRHLAACQKKVITNPKEGEHSSSDLTDGVSCARL